MTPDRWTDVERLYHDTLARPRAERDAFLDEVCGDDVDLRREVASLLACDDAEEQFIETPAIHVAARALAESATGDEQPAPEPGRTIGHYRLVRRLGQGGMGDVFLAVDERLRRQVALKFLSADRLPNEGARARLMREARVASRLNHPGIVTVHSIEDADGLTFIVMEFVAGATLAERMTDGPLPPAEVIRLGVDVAYALAAAHDAGLIHRDIKPANIMITVEGQAKILDFGIAKAASVRTDDALVVGAGDGMGHTMAGAVVGTVSYMSPEQARDEQLDGRTDVFSLGAVLYEASTGERPFAGTDVPSLLRQFDLTTPRVPSAIRPALVPGFDRIVLRALSRSRDDRHASARELAHELAELERLPRRLASRRRRQARAALVTIVALAVGGGWWWQRAREQRRRSAMQAVDRVEQLVVERRFREAHALAVDVGRVLPEDARLVRIMPVVTDQLSVSSEPPGADVYLTSVTADAATAASTRERRRVGRTPVRDVTIPRGDYLLEIVKGGFAPTQRTISSALARNENAVWNAPTPERQIALRESESGRPQLWLDTPAPIVITARLVASENVPERMVFVPGGDYELVGAGRPTPARVRLDDFFIDRFEVTNREFQAFVEAGGYERRELWPDEIDPDGRLLSWARTRALVRDRTGLPGPRGWANQRPPAGEDDHPVSGVSWYEARAYAAFRGRALPTLFQWQKAARDGALARAQGYVMPWGLVSDGDAGIARANFSSRGTAPVDRFPFGMSPFGAEQMAGNVAEWCLNQRGPGRVVAGGSWQDPPYLFGNVGAYPAEYASGAIGFRTVRLAWVATSDQGAMALAALRPRPPEAPVGDVQYGALVGHYRYDNTPFDARVEDRRETADWTRERISFAGAPGDRALAYLYLPKVGSPPWAVMHYVPSDAVIYGLLVTEEVEALVAPFIRDGRAIFVVVNRGFRERRFPPDFKMPRRASVAYRSLVVERTTDLRRGLDYLATRREVDMSRLTAFGTSIYSSELISFVVEPRYRAIVLLSAGVPVTESEAMPEANAVNFVPRVKVPVLLIAGRYDETLSFSAEVEPLYRLFRSPKQLVVFDGGHIPPVADWIPVARVWMEKAVGR